jgi:pyridoxamine 5'-phosphate oxidase
MNSSIADLRLDYARESLLETDVAPDPVDQFQKWWQQVLSSEVKEPNAMTLATASSDGMPSARIVLLKGFTKKGFVFFTNYASFKGRQLDENPRAVLVFFWKELERQVRITGLVNKLPANESDTYYLSRPEGSRIGAWASPQSRVIPGRDWLDSEYLRVQEELKNKKIDRPPHWGGYIVQPVIIEFWQGRPSRLHDRIQYTLQDHGEWSIERLAP